MNLDVVCGIAGIFSLEAGREEFTPALEKMSQALAHRGPDDRGMASLPHGVMASRRLSIIDLTEAARQPMTNEEGSVWVAFNGEIYNYRALRGELAARGHSLRSTGDCEVLVHGYEEWGMEGLLERLRGMFAFSLYDSKIAKLYAARDRLGIKPIYYAFRNGRFIFASEAQALRASGLIDGEIDLEAVGLYLAAGSIPPPKTVYRHVAALEPGHYLSLSSSGLSKTRYYDTEETFANGLPGDISEQEALDRVLSLLVDTVRCHLVADVPVGAFLSGGVDSTSIVSLIREAGHEPIRTVSVVFPETPYDESRYARIASEAFATEHTEVEVKAKDLAEQMDKIFAHMDQPTVDGINTYFVSWAASKAGLKVALSGLGGDELFWGYPSFRVLPRIDWLLRTLQLLSLAPLSARALSGLWADARTAKLSAMLEAGQSLAQAYRVWRGLFTRAQIEKLLEPELAEEALRGLDSWPLEEGGKIKDPHSRVSFLETTCYMANQLLRDTDVFSMAHSLEVRVPFVDHELVGLVARLPKEYKAGGAVPKRLLVKALDARLPQEIVARPKMGFTFPFDDWLKGELKDLARKELLRSRALKSSRAEELLSDYLGGRLHWSRVWALVVLGRWVG